MPSPSSLPAVSSSIAWSLACADAGFFLSLLSISTSSLVSC
jgi:hypothetical protein